MSLHYLHHNGLYSAFGTGPHAKVFQKPIPRDEFEAWLNERGYPALTPGIEDGCPFYTDEEALEVLFASHELRIVAKFIAILLGIPAEKASNYVLPKREDGNATD